MTLQQLDAIAFRVRDHGILRAHTAHGLRQRDARIELRKRRQNVCAASFEDREDFADILHVERDIGEALSRAEITSPLIAGGVGRWAIVTIPLLALAAWVGSVLAGGPVAAVAVASVVFVAAYLVALRPVIARVPWPDRVRVWMLRMRLIPAAPEPVTGGKP